MTDDDLIMTSGSSSNLPHQLGSSIPIRPVNSTSGSAVATGPLYPARLTERARAVLRRVKDPGMVATAARILEVIEESTAAMAAKGSDQSGLPVLSAFLAEDGSLSLEWATPQFRLAFNLETTAEDSSWYLVTFPPLRQHTFNGFIEGVDLRALVLQALSFVAENS